MAWDYKNFCECNCYGQLYIIKNVLNNGKTLHIKKIRKKKNKFYEDGKLIEVIPSSIDQNQTPEIGDYVYECAADKSISLLKTAKENIINETQI